MVSRLEDTLLLRSQRNDRTAPTLFNLLDDHTLRQLRKTCRALRYLVDQPPNQLFRTLYINLPIPAHREIESLKVAAQHCHVLYIRVCRAQDADSSVKKWFHSGKRESGAEGGDTPAKDSARQRWRNVRQALTSKHGSFIPSRQSATPQTRSTPPDSPPSSDWRPFSTRSAPAAVQADYGDLLAYFGQLERVAIDTQGDPAWPGQTELEETLLNLRVAFEKSGLQHLWHMRLAPIHAGGIMHFRWSGFGAFGKAPASAYNLWQRLSTLDLQIQNPFSAKHKLTDSQRVMFKKLLHEYLHSFAPTLKVLRFMWLGDEGPSPVTLELEPGLKGEREPIRWKGLQELWLGNIELPHRTIRALPERVPTGTRLKTLRGNHRASKSSFDDAGAWLDVLLSATDRSSLFNRTSSLYSQG